MDITMITPRKNLSIQIITAVEFIFAVRGLRQVVADNNIVVAFLGQLRVILSGWARP